MCVDDLLETTIAADLGVCDATRCVGSQFLMWVKASCG